MEVSEYRKMTNAGAEGLVLYQETYHRPSYAEVHRLWPKKEL
jgi:2-iminoacetate synthase